MLVKSLFWIFYWLELLRIAESQIFLTGLDITHLFIFKIEIKINYFLEKI